MEDVREKVTSGGIPVRSSQCLISVILHEQVMMTHDAQGFL